MTGYESYTAEQRAEMVEKIKRDIAYERTLIDGDGLRSDIARATVSELNRQLSAIQKTPAPKVDKSRKAMKLAATRIVHKLGRLSIAERMRLRERFNVIAGIELVHSGHLEPKAKFWEYLERIEKEVDQSLKTHAVS